MRVFLYCFEQVLGQVLRFQVCVNEYSVHIYLWRILSALVDLPKVLWSLVLGLDSG